MNTQQRQLIKSSLAQLPLELPCGSGLKLLRQEIKNNPNQLLLTGAIVALKGRER